MNPFINSPLTKKQPRGYDMSTTAKNSGQNWHSEKLKMRGRILIVYGFFYARKINRVMTGCIEESSDSPRSFLSGRPILYSLSPSIGLESDSLTIHKGDCTMLSIIPTSGNTPANSQATANNSILSTQELLILINLVDEKIKSRGGFCIKSSKDIQQYLALEKIADKLDLQALYATDGRAL
jgi:hypothetical protein